MELKNITDEHIEGLASFCNVSKDDITEIRRKDGEWCILYWKMGYNDGRVFVSNDEVYFSDDDGRRLASFDEIQYLLDLGYKIFKTN